MNRVTRQGLLEVLQRIQNITVLVVGDFMLDKYVWGTVDRVSPEAPVPVLVVDKEEYRPGGAGNVAANVSAMGAVPIALGLVGNDADSSELLLSLQERHIDVGGLVASQTRPTTTKCRLVAHGQQLVRMDRESTIEVSEEERAQLLERTDLFFPSVQGVIMQDYNKGVLSPPVIDALIQRCKTRGLTISVDPKFENFFSYKGVTLFKPNEKEIERAMGFTVRNDDHLLQAGQKLKRKIHAELLLVTSGEHGMTLIVDEDRVYQIPTKAQEVFDVSGAGDTVISVMTLGLVSGARPEEAAYLANTAAGICVSKVGTQPVHADELVRAVERDDALE